MDCRHKLMKSTRQVPQDQAISNKAMPQSQGSYVLLGVISFRRYSQRLGTERPEDIL